MFVLSSVKFYKREPSRQIIIPRPRELFVIDLTYIPDDLRKKIKLKYILNCLVNFSKFLILFLIEKKS